MTAISLPRQDHFHGGINDDAYYQDKPMNAKEFVDETVLSVSFSQSMLGAACYEQSTQLIRIMNDISEDHEFSFLERLIEEVRPTTIIANKSQDLAFIKLLSSRYTTREKLQRENKETTNESTEETTPTWDALLAYSTDEPEDKDEIDEEFDAPSATLYKLPNDFFKMPRALQRLKMMVGADDSKMTDEEKYMIVAMRFDIEAVNMMRSFGALLFFLDETRLGVENQPLSVPSPIKSIKTMTLEDLVDIDYSTIQSLDILPKDVESKKSGGKDKSLYALVDRCRSTVGKKCLRKWFRNPTTNREILISRQKCVHYFKQDWNAEVTVKVASLLAKVKSLNNVFQRFESGTAKILHWDCFVSTVNALVEMVHILRQTPISSELPVENSLLTEVSEIAVISGSIINFPESRTQGRVTVMPGIDEELDRLRDTYENMTLVLTAIAKQECARLGIDSYSNVACVYIPLVGFVLSLPSNFPVEAHRDMSLVYARGDELRVRNETTEKLDEEYGDILMKLIDSQTAIILTLKTRVLKKKRSINKLLAVAGRTDALVSLGLVAAENGWNCPTLIDEPVIEALELYHPMSVTVVKKSFVPNQVSSGWDGVKVSIITGPNACGKSVYMKSIGILAFLTHIGSFVPARHAKVGKVDRIVTRMFTVDSVLDGMSTFAKDVDQVALALRKATGNSLVIIDEFGKGTMTEVGLALLASCMTYWMNKGPQHCPHIFLASHFHALPKYIPLESNIAVFLTFKVLREGEGKIKYLFQLAPGIVDCSFAMAVAKEEGIPMPIIGRACRIYKALKSGTPLKHIKAEVAKNEDEKLVAAMDAVLLNQEDFMNVVEGFVVRQQREEIEAKARSEAGRAMEPEASEDDPTSVPIERSRNHRTEKAHSVISSKSIQSIDSVLDALLPNKKKKSIVAQKEKELEITLDSTKSPDPFSIDEEEEETTKSEDEDEEAVVSKVQIPPLQRLRSEEEEERGPSALSRASTLSIPRNQDMYTTPKTVRSDGRTGTKRASTPTTSDMFMKMMKTANTQQILAQDSQVPETIERPSRASSSNFLAPQLPASKKHVLDKVLQRATQDSMFQTPKSVRGSPNPGHSSRVTPRELSSVHSSMRTPNQRNSRQNPIRALESQEKSFNFTQSSIFEPREATSQQNLNLATPRTSSRREVREEDVMETPQTPKKSFLNQSSFTPMGSPFSIFGSQQSLPGNSFRSTQGIDDFFATPNTQRIDKPQKKSSQRVSFETPKSKSSEKRSRTSPKSTQKHSTPMSTSSFVLNGLIDDESQKTPRPRGDDPEDFDFEFQIDDNDPVYGKEEHFRSPKFDF